MQKRAKVGTDLKNNHDKNICSFIFHVGYNSTKYIILIKLTA